MERDIRVECIRENVWLIIYGGDQRHATKSEIPRRFELENSKERYIIYDGEAGQPV